MSVINPVLPNQLQSSVKASAGKYKESYAIRKNKFENPERYLARKLGK